MGKEEDEKAEPAEVAKPDGETEPAPPPFRLRGKGTITGRRVAPADDE